MAWDLDYVASECDHKIHNIVIQKPVTQKLTKIADAPVAGTALCGDTDTTCGVAVLVSVLSFGTKGTFDLHNGRIRAVIDLPVSPGSAPRVFVRRPGEYLRREVHPLSYSDSVEEAIYSSSVTYGSGVAYNEAVEVEDFDSAPQTVWSVDYKNSQITLYNYDNQFEWSMDYAVAKEDCPHCKGSAVENDLSFSPIGRLNIVIDTDKLSQTVMKAVLTDKGKNPNAPYYGTVIRSMLGDKYMMNGFLLRQEIHEQLRTLKKRQMQILMSDPEFYSPYEVLHDIVGVELLPTQEPRSIELSVVIKSLALDKVGTKSMKLTL